MALDKIKYIPDPDPDQLKDWADKTNLAMDGVDANEVAIGLKPDASVESYTITEPTGGWKRTFNPNTATENDLYDVLATILKDLQDAGVIQ